MNIQYKMVRVTPENFREHPQAICFINPKHEYYNKKVEWFIEQYAKGLRIIILYVEGEKRSVGFIEYVPGEYCWRAVNAKNYMFIHCLWIYGKKYQHQGLGSLLIKEAEKEAKNMNGVAVVTSNGSFIANKTIFLKNGYDVVANYGNDQLLVKEFKDGPLPSFNVNTEMLMKHKGLTIIYSRQCPWVARSVEEIKPILEEEILNPEIIEVRTSEQAQNAPSVYSVFNMIYNGKVLADRYISSTRFKNILRKHITKNH